MMGGNVDLCFFWVEVLNGTSETIPPFAVMEVSSVSSGIYTVVKPTGNNPKITLVNGGTAIAAHDYGTGTYDSPTYVLYDTGDGTPTLSSSTEWGPQSGSWKLHSGQKGFTPLGDSLSDYTSGSVDGTALFGRVGTAIPAATSLTVSAPGGTTSNTATLTFTGSGITNAPSGTTAAITIADASAGTGGLINASDQTLGAGVKTVDGLVASGTGGTVRIVNGTGVSLPYFQLGGVAAGTGAQFYITPQTNIDTEVQIGVKNTTSSANDSRIRFISGDIDLVPHGHLKIGGVATQASVGAGAFTFTEGLLTGVDGTTATGDMLYYSWASPGNFFSRLPIGSTGQVLTVVGGIPQWSTPSGGTGTVTSITAGTGLTGGTITTSGTIAIDTTGVSAGSYGSGSSVATFTVNARGQLTAASSTSISISSWQVSGLATSATTDATNASNISSGTLSNSRLSAVPNSALANSAITIAGTSTSLGGSITLDTITNLSSNGIIKRTAANTLTIATAGTDYVPATNGTSGQILTSNGSGGFGTALAATITIDGTAVSLGGTATRKIAVLTNEQTSGTDAGTATASTWVTVTLNTLQDPAGIVSSFGSNQFTLGNGTYVIRGRFPNFATDRNQASLRNVTSSSYDAYASSTRASSANQESSCSWMMKQITISGGSKTFEFRHWCGTTKATSGLGLSTGSGGTEVYATVEIEKIA
jgi:hypothetical protein